MAEHDFSDYEGLKAAYRGPAPGTPDLQIVCPTVLHALAVPKRRWLVNDWMPWGTVSALYGDGGTGKSLLAMQLMTCIATGRAFLGMETARAKTLGIFCEDSPEELHRRQDAINRTMNIEFRDLEDLHWCFRLGLENILMAFAADNIGSATALYTAISAEAQRLGTRLVVVDTAADTFGGNENVRAQVRQFINLLGRLAIDINGSVLLCAHPSVAGMSNGTGAGGSTAWSNTVRSRLYLSRVAGSEENDSGDTDALRILSRKKSNYAAIGDDITLRWVSGAFRIELGSTSDVVSRIEQRARNKADEGAFLACLDALTAQGRNVSASKTAQNYAPKEMLNKPEVQGFGRRRIAEAMERLFAGRKIEFREVWIGSNRHKKLGIQRVSEAEPE